MFPKISQVNTKMENGNICMVQCSMWKRMYSWERTERKGLGEASLARVARGPTTVPDAKGVDSSAHLKVTENFSFETWIRK